MMRFKQFLKLRLEHNIIPKTKWIEDKIELDKKNALNGKPAHPRYVHNPSKPLPIIAPKSHSPGNPRAIKQGHRAMVNTQGRLS